MALFGKKNADTSAPANAAPAAAPVAVKARKVKANKPVKSTVSTSGTVVGLNIGNAFIKAVEVTSKGGQLTVTGMGVIATPPESYANGNVLSVTALSNAIRTMWKQAGLSSKATIFSVAGSGSLVVRVIEVPKMTDGELADNMRVDADRYIPFPPSEVVMDFRALRDLPSDPDAANMEVLLAAAQREIIDLHIAVVQKAKLTPRAIDVEPLALARTMQLELRAQNPIIDYDDVTAVLNIGQTSTEISILRGDIVVFTRSVPNGGGALTQAIAQSMGIPTADAERLKIERGDALPPTGYGAGAGDDFGDFGDFGGGAADFSPDMDFGADDFGADTATTTAPATTATATDTSAATAGSDDPFDLDFFDQGPQQSEPGAGHGQKEDDEADQPSGINFSFDSMDDDLSPSIAKQDVTPASPPPPIPAPSAEAAPPSTDNFDLDDTFLPAMDATVASAASASTQPIEATPIAPATPATPATPIAPATPATPAIPSAFDFSDFDLPTVKAPAKVGSGATETEITAPTQKLSDDTDALAPAPISAVPTPAVPATPAPAAFSFGFSDNTLAEQAPATEPLAAESLEDTPQVAAPLSFEKTIDEPAITDEEPIADEAIIIEPTLEPVVSLDKGADVAAVGEPLADDVNADDAAFDVNDMFGAPVAAGEPAVAAVAATADDGGFDANMFGGDASADDFDMGALNATASGSEDFSTFGAGLSQTSETDDATLYAAMQPVLDDLATEVRRSLEFHLGRYPDTTFSRLVLVGGGAKLRNLDEFLANNLGVPASVGNPFNNIKVNAPGLPTEFVPTNAPLCAVALGLALRDFIE